MKKALLLSFCLLFIFNLRSQDTIVLRRGDVIQAKVVRIDNDKIRYRNFSNPNGSVYDLFIRDVQYIKYENGEKLILGQRDQQQPVSETSVGQNNGNSQVDSKTAERQREFEAATRSSNGEPSGGIKVKSYVALVGAYCFDDGMSTPFQAGAELGIGNPFFVSVAALVRWGTVEYAGVGKIKTTMGTVPLSLGFVFGDWDGFHVALRAGANYNFLLSQTVDGKTSTYDDVNSWGAHAKANVGFGFLDLTAEYYSSFEDLSKGSFFFGLSVMF